MQVISRMAYQSLFVLLGLVISLALLFPRPPRKPKADPKYYASPPTVILPVSILNQVDRVFSDFFGFRLIKPNTEYA